MANSERSAYHSTIVLSRKLPLSVERIFALLSDPADLCRLMSARGPLHMEMDDAQFTVGGRCLFRFGRKGDLKFSGTTNYCDIVPERRIVATDVVSLAHKPLSVATVVIELKPQFKLTQLKLTAQIAWLDGGEVVDGAEMPYAEFLDTLVTATPPQPVPLRRGTMRH